MGFGETPVAEPFRVQRGQHAGDSQRTRRRRRHHATLGDDAVPAGCGVDDDEGGLPDTVRDLGDLGRRERRADRPGPAAQWHGRSLVEHSVTLNQWLRGPIIARLP